jgi:hypothetical protein
MTTLTWLGLGLMGTGIIRRVVGPMQLWLYVVFPALGPVSLVLGVGVGLISIDWSRKI